MIICGQNKDYVAIVYSTKGGTNADKYVTSIIEKFARFDNPK